MRRGITRTVPDASLAVEPTLGRAERAVRSRNAVIAVEVDTCTSWL